MSLWVALLSIAMCHCAINDSMYTNYLSIPSDVGTLDAFWRLDDAAQRLHLRLRTPISSTSGYVGIGFCDKDIPDAVIFVLFVSDLIFFSIPCGGLG